MIPALQAERRTGDDLTATHQSAPYNLQWLIDPDDSDAFKRDHWEKSYFRVIRDCPHYYRKFLNLVDVDYILSRSTIRANEIRVLNQGKEVSLDNLGTGSLLGNAELLEAIYNEYRNGSTIVFPFLHERWDSLKHLCWSLGREFSAFFQANAYLTPGGAQGLNTHYDIHDVFVLQIEGSKHWRLYEGPIRLPPKSQPYDSLSMKPGQLLEEFDLNPGDLIYIPRGVMHDAVGAGSTSLHVTLGANTITWATLVLRGVEAFMDKDPRFRESLPIGFANSERSRAQAEAQLNDLLTALDIEAETASLISEATQAMLLGSQPLLEGHLLDLETLPQMTIASRVKRRPEVQTQLTTVGTVASLGFYGKTINFPAYVEPELRFITEADEFTITELADHLDGKGKLVLIETLIREGLLTMC